MSESLNILEKYFGYKSFRRDQEKIINEILNNKDVLAVMPTGAGKSICYQIPALMSDGLSIVISPLISLMKDQVDSLKSVGINGAFINSSLDKYEYEEILYGIKNNKYKILYIAPERLESTEFINILDDIDISQIAIDEAHCVSQWGHDFRVSYRKISLFIRSLKNRPIITAFTATASKEVRDDIVRLLELREPKVFVSGFDRENLKITIEKGVNKDKYILDYLKENKDLSGIIYCATRKNVESLYDELTKRNFKVCMYHAGLKDDVRNKNQEDFINDTMNIMIATNAFGMGIDKPDIRFVIHYNMPQSIEGYYQEIGRAGRDSEDSECILLYAPMDTHLQKYLIENGLLNEDRKMSAYKKLKDMEGLIHFNGCLRKYILNYFGEDLKEDCNNCSNCLSEGEFIDKTIDAQKVLSCIFKMKRAFGLNMVVDVLRGSKNSKVLSQGFNTLTTYGIMADCKKDDLISFINTLISHGFINQEEGTFPVLKPNQRSVDIIKGNASVILKEVVVKKHLEDFNELFSILKDLRSEISKEENVPPYIVFGDRTLREMSEIYPEDAEELKSISGVGEVKVSKYGDRFLAIIKNYILENNISKEKIVKDSMDEDVFYFIDTDIELYERLKLLRSRFSKILNKADYMLIPQNSLKEISGRYPTSINELKDITGFGPAKIDRYGDDIIKLVEDYKNEKEINMVWEDKGKRKVVIDGEKRSSKEISIDMLLEGNATEEITKKTEVHLSTILGYVTEYIKETGDASFSLSLNKYFNEDEEKSIIKVCEEVGIENLNNIKKKLEPSIGYEKIRSVILKKYYNIS